MSRFNLAAFALFGLVWAGYWTWSSGYKAGYDDGNEEAWTTARAALSPHESDGISLVSIEPRPAQSETRTAQTELVTEDSF